MKMKANSSSFNWDEEEEFKKNYSIITILTKNIL